MKKSTLILALAFTAGLLALNASAQFTFSGTDNFGDGVLNIGAGQRWTNQFGSATGAYSESGGLLNYTSTTEGQKFLRWTSINSATDNNFGNDWTAAVTVTNTNNPGAGYVSSGFQIMTTWNGNGINGSVPGTLYTNAYYAFMLVNGGVESEWSKYDAGTDDFTAPIRNYINTGDTTDVILRLNWASATSLLTASYSLDAGATYTTATTFNLAGAEAGFMAPYNNKFSMELFSASGDGAGAISGGVSFDNMSVSAVPEPSTYAAFAGLGALGLVMWRRRQAVRAASA